MLTNLKLGCPPEDLYEHGVMGLEMHTPASQQVV